MYIMETPLKIFKDSVKAKMKEQAELIGGDNWITDENEFKVKMKPEIERFKHEDKDQSDHHEVLNEVFKENMKRHRPLFYPTTKYYRQDQIEEEQLLLLQEKERRKQAQVLLEIQSLREPEASRAATATATASGAANGSRLERGHEHHQGLRNARERFDNDFPVSPGGNKKRRKTRKHRRKHKRKTKKHKRKRKTKKRKHRRKQKRKTHRR
jgi:hypothetical protein